MRIAARLSIAAGLLFAALSAALATDIPSSSWSETDGSNNSASPAGWPAGMFPNQVEPSARAMMGAIKRWYNHINPTVTSGGSANTQTLTYGIAPSAYVSGDAYTFVVGYTNTSALTLNVNSLGAKAVQYGGAALIGVEFIAGTTVTVRYDGTQFQMVTVPPKAPYDIRLWGNIGTSDDSAVWAAADTAMNTLSTGVPRSIYLPVAQTNLKNFHPVYINRITGAGRDISIINLASGSGTTDLLIQYDGAGPIELDNMTLQCPIYNPTTRASPAGVYAFRVGLAIGSTLQSSYVRVHDVKTIGCQNGLRIVGAQYVDLENIFNDRPWEFGWVVADSNDTATVHTREIHIHHTYGVSAGQYCGSIPADGTNVTLAARGIDISDVGCDGSGFKDTKMCFDFTGSSFDFGTFSGWGRNCRVGGLEIKRTADNTSEVPTGMHGVRADFTYYSSMDSGWGVAVSNPNASAADGTQTDLDVRGVTVGLIAPARQASTSYESGVMFKANSKDYKVVTPGTTDSGGGPSTTGNGILDGTAYVDYVQAARTTLTNLSGLYVSGLSRARFDITAYNTGFGVLVEPSGGLTASLDQIDLRLIGANITKACLQDVDLSTGVSPTIGVRLSGGCSSLGGTSSPAIYIGNVPNSTVNLDIVGGVWRQDTSCPAGDTCDPAGLIRIGTASGAQVNLTVSNAAHLVGFQSILYTQGPVAATFDGGMWEITGAGSAGTGNAAAPLLANGAGATGTVEANGVRVKSVAAVGGGAYQGWQNQSSAAVNFYTRLIRGFSAAAPTNTACNYGDMYRIVQPSASITNGWACTTASTSAGTWTSN